MTRWEAATRLDERATVNLARTRPTRAPVASDESSNPPERRRHVHGRQTLRRHEERSFEVSIARARPGALQSTLARMTPTPSARGGGAFERAAHHGRRRPGRNWRLCLRLAVLREVEGAPPEQLVAVLRMERRPRDQPFKGAKRRRIVNGRFDERQPVSSIKPAGARLRSSFEDAPTQVRELIGGRSEQLDEIFGVPCRISAVQASELPVMGLKPFGVCGVDRRLIERDLISSREAHGRLGRHD